jgi:hypothetical protein
MIKNYDQVRALERDLMKNEKTNLKRNFKLVDAVYYEAVELGIFPMKNPLDGLEIDIKIAKVVNHIPGTSGKNSKRIE